MNFLQFTNFYTFFGTNAQYFPQILEIFNALMQIISIISHFAQIFCESLLNNSLIET